MHEYFWQKMLVYQRARQNVSCGRRLVAIFCICILIWHTADSKAVAAADERNIVNPRHTPHIREDTYGIELRKTRNSAKSYEPLLDFSPALMDVLIPVVMVSNIVKRESLQNNYAYVRTARESKITMTNVREEEESEVKNGENVTLSDEGFSNDEGENNMNNNGNSNGDACIGPTFRCDYMNGDTCYYNREVGDSITLAINASATGGMSYTAHWTRYYSTKSGKNKVKVKIEPEHTPWNIVVGSNGMELRLSPITDTDMDPNSFVASVLSVSDDEGPKKLKPVRELIFHINILPIDMGTVYAGEEININIENFLTVPAQGLSFQWGLEKQPPDSIKSLPSNIKISRSGKSITIKELKKNQEGILVCVVYSSAEIVVAKRRFFIQKPKTEHRRSLQFRRNVRGTAKHRTDIQRKQEKVNKNSKREKRSRRHVANKSFVRNRLRRLSISEDNDWNEDVNSPKSYFTREIAERFQPPLYYLFTDSKSKSIRSVSNADKENSFFGIPGSGQYEEGTLFGTIPKEVHYVNPTVRLISHEDLERSLDERRDGDKIMFNCTSHFQCGPKASCLFLRTSEDSETKVLQGYCRCNPEYEGDGLRCHRPTDFHHRDKRVRRAYLPPYPEVQGGMFLRPSIHSSSDGQNHPFPPQFQGSTVPRFGPQQQVINQNHKFIGQPRVAENSNIESEGFQTLSPDDEDSNLLGKCDNSKSCSLHAACVRAPNLQAYCKCRPGYRGNGIFCWEIPDYVPPAPNLVEANADYK